MMWKELEIDKTKDKDTIRKAYLAKLHLVNPEDDEEGFKKLRKAYEDALAYADTPEDDDELEEKSKQLNKDEVDVWLDKIDELYGDISDRIDIDKWNILLHDSVCDDLDTEIEAGEKLLVYFMSHSFLPQKVWVLIDKRFDYSNSINSLKEKFPESFINYIIWMINNPTFLDYDLFEGNTKDRPDEFINKLHEIKNAEENENIDEAQRLIQELKGFEITHPYIDVEEANCLLLKAGNLSEFSNKREENAGAVEYRKKALDIMDELDFEYSSNMYIHRVYGEALLANKKIDKAYTVFDEIARFENGMINFSALLGKAKCMMLKKNYEEAKEMIEDILEEKVQDIEALSLLDIINEELVKKYSDKLIEKKDKEIFIKLGWCYYQQKKFSKGLELLEQLDDSEEYDYINLKCRLFLANEEYDKAYPLAEKWLSMIEDCVDDGSREMTKRKNRLSLAHFSIGVCLWEINEEEREKAVDYIEKSIHEENNRLVKLSYMEQLARFYLADKQYEKCIDKCTEIIQIDRGFFPAYVHRQRANYELKNAKDVIEDYYNCTELYPDYVPPYILAAEVYFAFEQYDDIEEIIKKASETGLESDSLKLYEIRVLHYKNFTKDNIKRCIERILKLEDDISKRTEDNPTDIEKYEDVIREHALICWDMDDNDKALKVIDDYLLAHEPDYSLQNLKIDIYNQSGKTGEALKLCRKLFKENPSPYMQTKLGICYEKVEDYKNALFCYKGAYDKDPEYQVVLRRLMFLYSYLSNRDHDLDKSRLGIKYATEYIDITDSAEGYMERGNLYIDIYELDLAVDDCKKAIERDENSYYAYNNLGCALLKLRRIDEAILPLEQAIELDEKKDHLPYLNLAECYIVRGEFDKAINIYNKMIKLFNNLFGYKENVAKLYCKKGEYQKAVKCYEKIIEDRKNNNKQYTLLDKIKDDKSKNKTYEKILMLYCDIADVYRQSGDDSKTEYYYKKVLNWWKRPVRPDISVKSLIRIAEYYRDRGELKKAEKMIDYAEGKLTADNSSAREKRELYFMSMTIAFEMGFEYKAKAKSEQYIDNVKDSFRSIKEVLSDLRYRPMWSYNIGIAKLCAGEINEAEKYFDQINQCKLCVMCECLQCFEYFFGMGLVAEMKKEYDKAAKLYYKAIKLKGDYPCARRHLTIVNDKMKI